MSEPQVAISLGGAKVSLFPIFSVSNYREMLTKLAWYTFGVAIVCIFTLSHFAPPIKKLIALIENLFPREAAEVLPFPASLLGVFTLAIGVGLIAHAIRLHDRLSDLFRIRKEFDVHYILYPLALASGATLSITRLHEVKQQRKRLMGSTFYAYVSSTKPEIDSHTVIQALTNWSWYWVCLEATTLLTLTALVLAIYGAWLASTCLLLGCTMLLLFMRFFRLQSADYAATEVEQVLRDDTRRAAVAAEFNAL
ncbi:hypothetical protein [Aminobacter sp. SS-2016]|uniref:hypothetical protein n=1 Tax=Aminobacter sp. Y103A TaxID=1870862 RepID=UPI00257463D6|nr:hypothetical protein [Aminobacter sp. SS-2016]